MAFRPFQLFRVFSLFRSGAGDDGKISQPVALEDPLTPGTYFVNAGGELLTHGTARVAPGAPDPLAALIASLFGAEEQGGLWLPGPDTCYTDEAGTTPAAENDTVARIDDLSGNGNHAIQASTAERPALKKTAGGLWYLEFDGVDDTLVAAGLQVLYDASSWVYSTRVTSGTNDGCLSGFRSGTANNRYYIGPRLAGKGASRSVLATTLTDVDYVCSAVFDASKLSFRRNYELINTYESSLSGLVPTQLGGLPLGYYTGPEPVMYPGHVYGVAVVADAVLSSDQILLSEQFMAGRSGVPLP